MPEPADNFDKNAGAPIWDENGIVFYANNLRSSTGAQSMASLMAALVKLGRTVYLITNEQPNGEDFVTDTGIKRFVLCYLEFEGYSTAAAFYKVLGELPVKTVVFTSPFTAKTYQCFIAAEKLGRCIILAQEHSPYLSLAAGNVKAASEYLYMIKNAACVKSLSEQDCMILESLGANKVIHTPFYFPYFDKEVSASKLEGQKIVYYTTYADKNTRSVIIAFARLHERFPDTKMHVIIIFSDINKVEEIESLMADVANSELSDCLTIENKVLKPLRALREASVSITYAHLNHMPKTVMESICAGIPAIMLQDADYSSDSHPAICMNAADTFAIEEKLAELMDKSKRVEYAEKVGKLLDPGYRLELAKRFSDEINEITDEFNRKLDLCVAAVSGVRNRITSSLQQKTALNGIYKALILDKISCGEIIAASVLCGIKVEEIMTAYKSTGVLGQRDYAKMLNRIAFWKEYQDIFITSGVVTVKLEKQYTNENLTVPDMVAALAVGGMENSAVPAVLPGIFIDSRQAVLILQNAVNTNKCFADADIDYINPSLLEIDDIEGCSPAALNIQNALKSFSLENMSFLNYKRHSLVKNAIKLQAWYKKPFSEMGLFGKIISFPFRLRTQLKISIHLRGKKRLAKRKVTEVDPADTRKIQLLVLQIMLEFEKICKKHNLRYYIAGGSILGGIRHKGFIPWDDDIDITMPRPDYEKLLKIAPKELPVEYILEKDCVPYCHNRIEIRGTTFNSGLRKGRIFLDILALEGSPDDKTKRLQHEAKCKFWRGCMLIKARPLPAIAFNRNSTVLFIKTLILKLIPRRFLKWRWHNWATKYSTGETNSWVCLPASIYTYEQERFPKEYWGEPVFLEFEGFMMPTMSHWEDYLVCHFGDYMKMPPETTRKSHHYVFEYDLGKYANISTEELEKKVLGK
jgi:lipopolysaccharide cholinephosphotransferase